MKPWRECWDLDTNLGRMNSPEAFPSGGCGRRWVVPDVLGSFVVVVDVVKLCFFLRLLTICSGLMSQVLLWFS